MNMQNKTTAFMRRELLKTIFAVPIALGTISAVGADLEPLAPPSKVANSMSGWLPKSLGVELELKKDGNNYRVLRLFHGRAPEDLADPNTYVAYHQLPLSIVKPKVPQYAESCDAIHTLDDNGDIVYAELRFLRTSREVREAASSRLQAKYSAFFAEKRKKNKDLQVSCEPVPAEQIVMIISDLNSKLVLAHAKAHIVSVGDEIAMRFAFNLDAFREFSEAWQKGRIEFQPYLLVSAIQADLGTRATSITYSMKDSLEQVLMHDQRHKRREGDVEPPLPILRDDRQRLNRYVSGQVRESLSVANAVVLHALPHNDSLINGVFARVQIIDAAEFTTRFPQFNAQSMAEYLKPMIEKHSKSKSKIDMRNHTRANEATDSSTSGFGFSYFGMIDIGFGNSDAKRNLDAVSEESGITFKEGVTKDSIVPTHVEIHQLSATALDVKLDHVTTVAVGRGQVSEFLTDTPFGAMNDVTTLMNSLAESVKTEGHVTRLTHKKAVLEGKLNAELDKLKATHDRQKLKINAMNDVRSKLNDSHVEARDAKHGMGHHEGCLTELHVFKELWKIDPKDGAEPGNRMRDRDSAKAIFDTKVTAVGTHNSSYDQLVTDLATEDTAIAASEKEIRELHEKIDTVTRALVSTLVR
jgi:hypothetical protein